MADDQQAQIVEETPQEAMPTSDQTVETKEVIETPEKTTELPDDAKERTRDQFNKLKQQLAEEREARLKLERTSQAISSPEWYDPATGIVDPNKLQYREQTLMSELNTLKQQVAGYTRQQEEAQEKEAYAAYPELKTNDKFQEKVIQEMAINFASGKQITMKEAADNVLDFARGLTSKAEKDGARKALEQLAPKEQASLEATGRSDRRLPSRDLDSLSRQTRYGGESGTQAILERLKGIPSV